jgi:hypothetical protein
MLCRDAYTVATLHVYLQFLADLAMAKKGKGEETHDDIT